MRNGAILSGLLHLIVILLLLTGLPDLFRRDLTPPPVIPIDIVNIADLTQAPALKVKPKQDAPKKEVKEEKPVPPKPTPVVEETPEPEAEVTPEAEPDLTVEDILALIPEEKEEKPKEKEKEKPKEKKKEKKKDKKKKKKPAFDSLLANLDKTEASSEGKAQPEQDIDSTADHAADNISDVLSITEQDLFRQQMKKHWNWNAGSKDAKELKAEIRVILNTDCTVQTHTVIKTSKAANEPRMKAFTDSAIRALHKAGSLKLPSNRCGQSIVINFDPSVLL